MMALDALVTFGQVPPPPDVVPAPVAVDAPKPLIKSKSVWPSVAAGMTTAALADWRVCVLKAGNTTDKIAADLALRELDVQAASSKGNRR